jgi:hypothetical protein
MALSANYSLLSSSKVGMSDARACVGRARAQKGGAMDYCKGPLAEMH